MSYIITPSIREEAALICAVSASSDGSHWYWDVREAIGASLNAASLAADALAQLTADEQPTDEAGRLWSRESDAETEAALRTGFVPYGWTAAT